MRFGLQVCDQRNVVAVNGPTAMQKLSIKASKSFESKFVVTVTQGLRHCPGGNGLKGRRRARER